MNKRLKLTLLIIWIVLIIGLWLSFFTYYRIKNIDDSWCPRWYHLHNWELKLNPCNDCNLTKKQIELWEKYINDYECNNKEKFCYLCEKPPLPDCQCTYDFKYVKVSDFVWYLLNIIY